ncbi:hypothetical protein TVAG_391090 [Trichomonas vaginalis G3]|uniref:Major Facilitator Superfamily protein n=1 Tax=Trichomonas vaginalis (strain ATCC PRA-98 / G3) TaxID=412133 RepID=A2DFM2_TRIV3|nr:Major Facilitator Superfamily (MFS) general substrate transporter family [Trichomonas vaginalis G3]EAY20725.1 hypothetical protein TVAG_391090 [Trichomonas vaginalis G3]KAI5529500.1 Major Facilitator Superfamily (MFS) general substrate transporter family [Trichomonas vaginalis G3]|eukprot:XP_001581711.1 hypothetical protein [Trichomonas vaginalis G3]
MTSSVSSDMLLATNTEDTVKKTTFKTSFLITLPVFMGYACCFSLQHRLSFIFGLTEGASGDPLSYKYGVAASLVYGFNLIFRVLGHNIVFGCLPPKWRVTVALCSMIIGMSLFVFLSYQKYPNIAWAYFPFAFCGVCEGSYGPNMLNVVNELGDTRLYVVLAMPVGVACVTILGFALMGFGMPFQWCYIATGVCLILGIIIYHLTVFPAASKLGSHQSNFSLRDFGRDLLCIGDWFPKIWFCSLVFLLNMVCLALFNPGCTLYVYESRVTFHLFGFTVNHDIFILLYNICSFVGDFVSRKVMNKKRIINPIWFFFMLCFGFALNISLIPEIVPFAAFCFSWANGGLYVQCTKLIGLLFEEKYHLTATSTWLFIGDAGSFSGANIVQLLRPAIGAIKKRMF